MSCDRHPDRPAVAQCEECGASICEDCVEATEFAVEQFGTLCVKCTQDKCYEAIEIFKKDSKKRLTRIIISVILYIIGAALIISGISGIDSGNIDIVIMIPIGIILCGLYTGLTWRKVGDDDPNGVKDGWLLKIIFFLIGTAFGVIVTPIRVVIDGIEIGKNNKSKKVMEYSIEELRNV